MKKLLYLILITPLILTACSEDLLNKTPESTLTSGNFYKTKDQLEQAVNGAYAVLRNTKVSSGSVMAEMRADNTHYYFNPTCRGGADGTPENIDSFTDISLNPDVNDMWINLYNGISRANSVLGNVSAVEMTQQDADMIMGQAKFLRALFYFDLVRYFGGVPLYLKPVLGVSDAYLSRSTVADV